MGRQDDHGLLLATQALYETVRDLLQLPGEGVDLRPFDMRLKPMVLMAVVDSNYILMLAQKAIIAMVVSSRTPHLEKPFNRNASLWLLLLEFLERPLLHLSP
ncbi:hypothetical protein HPB49_014197 [Dermacentor silvarum]|uniref:Uncharacterized protein n=1 Tax=Dermacentor silvarum TaxID=543639 RepID=A0ACB8DDS1_DERSI|nr:hypothetical protein HPB49_014197 [Dermacentor silvarum]